MAEIKLLKFEPIGSFALGDKTMYFEDAPGGMSYSMEHLNPVSARRTQDGTLITQTIRYNKKNINLTMTIYDIVTETYFRTLYEEGYRMVMDIWSENPSTFVEEKEFTGTVQMLSFNSEMDQTNNTRTLNMVFAEA